MTAMEDELLTIDEVAAILKVSKSYVFRLMRDGQLTVIRDGKRFTRILRSDLIAYVEKHRQPINDEKEGKT